MPQEVRDLAPSVATIHEAKAECRVCHAVQVVKADVKVIFDGPFGAWCSKCKDRTMHAVVKVKEEIKKEVKK